jgi:hypothetical protein
VVGEVEGHVAEAGWDQPPQLFALVQTEQLLRAEPQLASTMGLVAGDPSSLTPIAQEPLGDAPLDEQLASLVFGDEVLGVVLAHDEVLGGPRSWLFFLVAFLFLPWHLLLFLGPRFPVSSSSFVLLSFSSFVHCLSSSRLVVVFACPSSRSCPLRS